MSADRLPFRDMLTIFQHELRCVWLIAVDMRDRSDVIGEDHVRRLTQAIQRIEALKGGGV